jgi:uncharacterized Zn finger protein (UPF0148 family)
VSFCVQCGSKKIDGAKFCAGCGTPFTEVMNERLEPEQEIAEEIQEATTTVEVVTEPNDSQDSSHDEFDVVRLFMMSNTKYFASRRRYDSSYCATNDDDINSVDGGPPSEVTDDDDDG